MTKKIDDIINNISEIDINNLDFTASKLLYKTQSRFASTSLFYRVLLNGKQEKRNWLSYSNLTGKLYCIPCRLFGKLSTAFSKGFNDWKRNQKITDHENCSIHKENNRIYVNRSNKQNKNFRNHNKIEMSNNINYWKNILVRIVEVIKFLSSRGLPLRGNNQIIGNINNGNYLGCIELLAKFYPLLQQH